jgi:hypothetical protein
MLRWTRVLAVPACAALILLGAGSASAAPTATTAAGPCSVPDYPGSGYFTSLRVSRTSCSSGRRLALAYYRCRTENGRRGRCHRRVNGYRCSERRESISTEINGRVTCRRGSKRVVHTYQQNL